MTNFVFQKYST